MFVYLITNTINGARYVGQTKQTLSSRWSMHVSKNHCRYLYNAIHKYGRENFLIEALVEVPTKELANEFEIECIDRYKTMFPNGYNILPGGDERPPLSEEARQKISEFHRGRKRPPRSSPSQETRKKLSEANRGKVLSEEHKRKISESCVGRKISKDHIQKMQSARLGMPGPRLGQEVSVETRAKQGAARLGKKPSEETRQKMKAAQQARRIREWQKASSA